MLIWFDSGGGSSTFVLVVFGGRGKLVDNWVEWTVVEDEITDTGYRDVGQIFPGLLYSMNIIVKVPIRVPKQVQMLSLSSGLVLSYLKGCTGSNVVEAS
jgi:hypothetical protein